LFQLRIRLQGAGKKLIDYYVPGEQEIKKIYTAIASSAGINVIYDPQLKNDKFSIDLRGNLQWDASLTGDPDGALRAIETVAARPGRFTLVAAAFAAFEGQSRREELRLYPLAVRLFAEGRLRIEGDRVRVLPETLAPAAPAPARIDARSDGEA